MLRSDANTTKFSIATKAQKHKIPLKFCEILCFSVFVAREI